MQIADEKHNCEHSTTFSGKDDFCDICCQPPKTDIPKRVENLPGLNIINYRIGAYNDFKKNLLEKVSQKQKLGKLTSKSDDDPSVSLLDAWAVVADVLTFYQERIANEAYIRTSNDPKSIFELARSVGYQPSPGTSAGTYVQFNIENSPESIGKEITIEAGVKLQSLPAQGETPQIFETAETIKARSEWNQLSPNLSEPQFISKSTSAYYFKGTDTKLKPNDRLLILTEEKDDSNSYSGDNDYVNDNDIASRDKETEKNNKKLKKIIKPNNKSADENTYRLGKTNLKFAIKVIEKIDVDAMLGRTMVTVFASKDKKDAHNDEQTSVLTSEILNDTIVNISEKIGKTIPKESLDLTKLNQSDLTALAIKNGWSVDDFFKMLNEEFKQKQKDLTAKTKVYAFRIRANLFGYNAPERTALPENIHIGPTGNWSDLNICSFYSLKVRSRRQKGRMRKETKIYLDNTYPRILPQSWIIVESSKKENKENKEDFSHLVARPLNISYTADETLTEFFGTGIKVTSLAVNLEDVQFKCDDFDLRNTTIYAQSEELLLNEDRPVTDSSSTGNAMTTTAAGINNKNSICLDHLVNGLSKGRYMSINGTSIADKTADKKSRIVKISEINLAQNRSFNLFTELAFEDNIAGPANVYKLDTVSLNANVSYATHGESTIEEPIGSADPSLRQQEFVLKQSPLAYIPSPYGQTAISTLEIRVNSILWKEIPASRFYFMKPTDQVYMTRTDVNGNTHVIFSDPAARPPLGIENIVARYRVGGGKVGNVKENQINILVTRPLGVKSVSNPMTILHSASDPEDNKSVRNNIPNMVNTSQQIFSLQDYESFASSFKGISKSQAAWIWNGTDNIVSLTIASNDSYCPVDPESQLYKDLYISISENKDPSTEFRLDSFSKKFFKVKLKVKIDSNRNADKQSIISGITDVLETSFSSKFRQFGQCVSKEEIIVAVQQVPGVIIVDKVFLYTLNENKNDTISQIHSSSAHWDSKTNQISKAELLIIQKETSEIDVEEMMI